VKVGYYGFAFLTGITVCSGQPGYFLFDFSMIDDLS